MRQPTNTDASLLVVAGSRWQVPLTQKIKALGHRVLVLNPYRDSPAFAYADGFGLCDILDREACLTYAKKNGIDAVISDQSDIAMPTVAFLAEELGLPSIGVEMAALFTSKLRMREFCQKNEIPYPEFRLCHSLNEAVEFFTALNDTMIIKPLDSNSSRGVFKVNSISQLRHHFNEALAFSREQKAVLAERFISGPEFTVEGVKTPGGHFTLAISEKTHFKHNTNIANQLLFFSESDKYDYDLLRKANDTLIESSGLPFGLTHVEYKWENGRYYLIEMAARGGGNLISSHVVPGLTGLDTYRFLIGSSLGTTVNFELKAYPQHSQRCAVLHFFDAPSGVGKVKSVEGLSLLESDPAILAFGLNVNEGDMIKQPLDDSTRSGFYIACTDTRDELNDVMQRVNDCFRVEIELASDGGHLPTGSTRST